MSCHGNSNMCLLSVCLCNPDLGRISDPPPGDGLTGCCLRDCRSTTIDDEKRHQEARTSPCHLCLYTNTRIPSRYLNRYLTITLGQLENMSQLVPWFRETQGYLFQTIPHPTYLPFPILDLLGAVRLSVFVDQYVRGKAKIPDDKIDEGGRRPTFLQEAFGIAVLIFGGESCLAAWLGILPSWLQSPNGLILFCGMREWSYSI